MKKDLKLLEQTKFLHEKTAPGSRRKALALGWTELPKCKCCKQEFQPKTITSLYCSVKCGNSDPELTQKRKQAYKRKREQSKFPSHTREWYIDKYGSEIGEQKFKLWCEGSTIQKYIRKFGSQDGPNEYMKKNKTLGMSVENCLLRYKDPEIAKEKRSKWRSNVGMSLEKLIKRHGIQEGTKRYDSWKSKIVGPLKGRGSKESLRVFDPALKMYPEFTYHLGTTGSHEFWIYDPETKKYYFYDLYIKELNLIVEYMGETWHPKSAEDRAELVVPKLNIKYKDKWFLDREKEQVALNHGFIY